MELRIGKAMDIETTKNAVISTLKNGGVVVIRTDTIYGIIALASHKDAVRKVYEAKHRNPLKQCIVLITKSPQNSSYGAFITDFSAKASLPTSVIVPASNEPEWLLLGGDTIAYRVTRDPLLVSIIEAVGPVIAPSANPEGLAPANTIDEARAYFGDSVDYYVDGGEVPEDIAASEILKLNSENIVEVIRSQFTGQAQVAMPVKPHHSAGGLIFKDNKVLLIYSQPPRNSYDFPKGTLDEGESSETAAVREVFEETGYKTRILGFIDSTHYYLQTPKGEWRLKTVDYYLLESIDGIEHEAQREAHETFENVWLSIEDAKRLLTREINKQLFEKALKLR